MRPISWNPVKELFQGALIFGRRKGAFFMALYEITKGRNRAAGDSAHMFFRHLSLLRVVPFPNVLTLLREFI